MFIVTAPVMVCTKPKQNQTRKINPSAESEGGHEVAPGLGGIHNWGGLHFKQTDQVIPRL